MVVQMDPRLKNTTPSESPLAMPTQDLRAWQGGARKLRIPSQHRLARLFVFGLTILLVSLGTVLIYKVISPVNITWLQVLFAALFALTFTWISFACASACLGFILILRQKSRSTHPSHCEAIGRTALLMPLYNEEPASVFATLTRISKGLIGLEAGQAFDVFILSDTRNEAVASRERECFEALRRNLGDQMAVYYRRRADNHHRKAGNIADFVTRWGGAYDHMIVLDADSDMSPDTLLTLARTMASDPEAGIIQSLPLLRNRWTPYARMSQFAGAIYGPVVAVGLAAWHGRDGNYWGHNAIIRTRAFAEAAGLPELKGRRPFGGHILSHDFVEAALIRRAGWAVYMLPHLRGSFEEAPPSLVDVAIRDRRWAQGNLQHSKIVTAKGLHWLSRVHLIQGIMSYLASPLWLLLLLAGLGLSMVARFTRPDYFPTGFSLFPAWPVFDPQLALRLLFTTAVVLYLPKIMGLTLALVDAKTRRGCGGAIGLISSFCVETVLSMLLSPIMMLVQTRFVADIFLGRDSGWNPQNRNEAALPLAQALKYHASHVAAGLGFALAATAVSWDSLLWFLPIIAGLVLSPVISWLTSSAELGRWLWSINVFRIPEETARAASRARLQSVVLAPKPQEMTAKIIAAE
jgi:membrane glycosyltransferase